MGWRRRRWADDITGGLEDGRWSLEEGEGGEWGEVFGGDRWVGGSDEDADSLVVDIVENQVAWAIPGVAWEGAELAWLASTVEVLTKRLSMFATFDVGSVSPTVAQSAPRPHVAVRTRWLAFFPGLEEIAQGVTQEVVRDTAGEGALLTVGK